MKYPTKAQLIAALARAGELHHSYEKVYLAGERDERWAGFYAAYVLGRYGDFERPELVAEQLEKTPVSENWAADAAEAVLQSGSGRAVSSGDEQAREVMYVCPHCFSASEKRRDTVGCAASSSTSFARGTWTIPAGVR